MVALQFPTKLSRLALSRSPFRTLLLRCNLVVLRLAPPTMVPNGSLPLERIALMSLLLPLPSSRPTLRPTLPSSGAPFSSPSRPKPTPSTGTSVLPPTSTWALGLLRHSTSLPLRIALVFLDCQPVPRKRISLPQQLPAILSWEERHCPMREFRQLVIARPTPHQRSASARRPQPQRMRRPPPQRKRQQTRLQLPQRMRRPMRQRKRLQTRRL